MTKNEAQTRAELIDKLLIKSGWNVKDPTQVIEELDIIITPEGVTDLEALYGALSQQAFKGELDLSHLPLIQTTRTVTPP